MTTNEKDDIEAVVGEIDQEVHRAPYKGMGAEVDSLYAAARLILKARREAVEACANTAKGGEMPKTSEQLMNEVSFFELEIKRTEQDLKIRRERLAEQEAYLAECQKRLAEAARILGGGDK